MGAYLDGLEQAAANGQELARIASVASFFVSRVDAEIDKRLGRDRHLTRRWRCAAKAAVANSPPRLRRLPGGLLVGAVEGAGGQGRAPAAAAVGLDRGQEPDYSDTMYVSELVVADVVNTMPEKTLNAFADHGEVTGDAVTGTAAQSQEVFDAVAAQGIDITDVFLTLEDEGVDKFEKSWAELQETVKGQLESAG
jgi:transaldolase